MDSSCKNNGFLLFAAITDHQVVATVLEIDVLVARFGEAVEFALESVFLYGVVLEVF